MKAARLQALAAMIVLLSLAAAGAEPRTFFAPSERPAITASRLALLAGGSPQIAQAGTSAVATGTTPSTAVDAKPAPRHDDAVRLEGVSMASGGKAHAWIGGQRYEDGSQFRGQRLRVRRNGVLLVAPSGAVRLWLVGEDVAGGGKPPGEPAS